MSATYWLSWPGNVVPLTKEAESQALLQYGRSLFGDQWLLLSARDNIDAMEQATRYHLGLHPHQREILLFAQAYRGGAVDLPHGVLPGVGDTATVYPRTHRDRTAR